MPFKIVSNDIARMHVDAVVNSVDPQPAQQEIGPIDTGCAAITPAFGQNAKYVIHTAEPAWNDGSHEEESLLRSCYDNSLKLALEHGCRSVAFPLISGNNGFPKDKALKAAISAFSAFLLEYEMQVYLVTDGTSFRLPEKLFRGVASYIDQNFVDVCRPVSYSIAPQRVIRHPGNVELCETAALRQCMPCAPESKVASLEDLLKQADAGFTETLLKLIDQSGKKDPEIYKKANISKQHFSKIRNNPNYKPTKPTAIALALALELDLEATKDLIGRAGYALTNSSKFDLIIRYFIEQGNYNVVEINIALYEFDQSLLGA